MEEINNLANCVISAYELTGDGHGDKVSNAHAVGSSNKFMWYHLQSDHSDTVKWMTKQGVDEGVIDLLTAGESRPRAMPIADGTFLNLRGVNTNPSADPEDMVSIRVWFNEQQVITTRRRKLLSVIDLQNLIDKGRGPRCTSQLVSMLTEKISNRIGDVIESIEEDLIELEVERELSAFEIRRKMSELRRQIASIRRYLAPQREALDVLSRMKNSFQESDAHDIHLESDRMIRYVEDLDLARERTLLVQEELTSRIAEEQNSRMYLLSIVTAIFLPLSFLTGLFGMNVAGLPGTESPWAFGVVCLGMVLCAFALIIFMRWKKWM